MKKIILRHESGKEVPAEWDGYWIVVNNLTSECFNWQLAEALGYTIVEEGPKRIEYPKYSTMPRDNDEALMRFIIGDLINAVNELKQRSKK